MDYVIEVSLAGPFIIVDVTEVLHLPYGLGTLVLDSYTYVAFVL